jgi:hypothetical protein
LALSMSNNVSQHNFFSRLLSLSLSISPLNTLSVTCCGLPDFDSCSADMLLLPFKTNTLSYSLALKMDVLRTKVSKKHTAIISSPEVRDSKNRSFGGAGSLFYTLIGLHRIISKRIAISVFIHELLTNSM